MDCVNKPLFFNGAPRRTAQRTTAIAPVTNTA